MELSSHVPDFLSAKEIDSLLKIDELTALIEKALGNYSNKDDGGVVQPVRQILMVEKQKGLLGLMPAYSEKDSALTTKLVTVYPENKHKPSHQATILLFDPADGTLVAVMDGEVITNKRTAAASAVATKYLANPQSKVLAIIGAGHQARSHYAALSKLFHFTSVRVWSRTQSNADCLAKEINATSCETVQEAVKDADVIVTVTFATTPILEASWIKPGAHINAVGACRPDQNEIDPSLMNQAVIYCDCREAVFKESGDVLISKCGVYAEIGEVILGRKQAHTDKTTVFKSLGLAIEDLVAAKLVYDQYKGVHK